jgi:DNA-binding NarL/FixJ family response regulator
MNVIVAVHQPIFRTGVANLLAAEDDMRIIAQPLSRDHLLSSIESFRPQVLILSSGFFPVRSDIEGITRITSKRHIAILMLTETSERAADYFSLGVQGVIYRCASATTLIDAIRRLARGEVYMQTHATAENDTSRTDLVGQRVASRLSRRELRIVGAVVQGFKNREIAAQFRTSEQMIKNAVRVIYNKTGVSDRLELALFVMHHQVLAEAAAQPNLRMPISFSVVHDERKPPGVGLVV